MIKKLKVVALVVACALIFSGCSLVSKDPNKIENQVVASINGASIYRYQVDKDFIIDNISSNITITDISTSEGRSNYKTQLEQEAQQIATEQVLIQKAAELGITLTDDEKKAKRTAADSAFSAIKDSLRAEVENEAKLDTSINVDTETETRFQEQLKSMGFTADDYYNRLNDNALIEKLVKYTYSFAEVTDSDVRTWYDETLAGQQKEMDSNPAVFADDVNGNLIYTYVPEDTIAVKQVFLAFKDADIVEEARQLYNDGDTSEAMAILKPEIDALMPKALDIQQQLKSGAKIEDLIAEYGEDPGMASGSTFTSGYLVGPSTQSYISEFKQAVLGLKAVGDVSAPFSTYLGVHVVQTIKVYKQGVVPFDVLKDQIKQALLPKNQQNKYIEMAQQWQKDAKIVYYLDRLFN